MSTVRVKLWGSLRALVHGREVLEVEAATLGGVIDAIERDYPALSPQIRRGVSFSVDGLVYRDDRFVEVGPEQEIVMLPRMVGG